jgi:hypothetical protein
VSLELGPVIVYTAITAAKDRLKEWQVTEGASFVAFTDAQAESRTWHVLPAWPVSDDPVRSAKFYKVNPHWFFPDCEYSFWLDGSCSLRVPVSYLIERYLSNADIALFRHPLRDCVYDEAATCLGNELDDPGSIESQMDRYRAVGYPLKRGLHECTVLLRRHTPAMAALNELWWDEICRGSRRDQLSFDYCCWRLGVEPQPFWGTSRTRCT